jgi:hypothetical protein
VHAYSIDDGIRRRVYVTLGVAAFAVPGFCSDISAVFAQTLAWIRWPLGFGATFGLLFWLFDRFVWRWPLVRNVHAIPILDGEWQGDGLSSSYKTPESPDGHRFTMFVKIRQTFSRMEVFTETESSTSRSTMAGFELQHAVTLFRYAFENTPHSRANDELERHAGLMELRIHGPDELKGDYFSGKHRLGYGQTCPAPKSDDGRKLVTISQRYQRLLARRAPPEALYEFSKSATADLVGEHTKYLLNAMKPVDAKSTARLVEQGDRVQAQLSRRLEQEYPQLQFRRQGSVSNGTHIRYFSDVDVLVLIDKYVTLEQPQQPAYPYTGEPLDDLALLRKRCVAELGLAFPEVELDDRGSTAVRLEKSASLACAVDVVPSNWYDTNTFASSGVESDRGVQVLNREQRVRRLNQPFLFNRRLTERDATTGGLTRMVIRLLKTLKADVEEEGEVELAMSSFDIGSVVYRADGIFTDVGAPLDALGSALQGLLDIAERAARGESIKTVDDSREVFDQPRKLEHFVRLLRELSDTLTAARKENPRGLRSSVLVL